MIAFAVCVGDPEKFRRICLPGLQRVAGPDDLLIEAEHEQSIFAAYNEVLDAVRDRPDVEALVLLHEDTEVLDAEFAALVRAHVSEPDVAVVGAVGARDVSGLAWWEAECFGRVKETRGTIDFGGGTHEVDTVDGLVMALSPWAVRNLRFDEDAYSGFDAYDADFCAQARARGKRVVVAELPVAHRHNRTGAQRASSDGGSFERNDAIFRAKWLVETAKAPQAQNTAGSGAGVREAHGDDGYFEHTRPELRALVPAGAKRVLDVGCGAGALGAALKAERGCQVVGLEGFPDAADRARTRLDDALCVDLDSLEALPPETGTFDAMIFGDVLEHLRDPARLLRALRPSLSDDGVMIFSVPNVKHWTVLYPLLVKDRWSYEDAGLLDRTHVHFFTLEEISDMLDGLGLECVHLGVNDLAPLPPALGPLADLAARFGAERAEAASRLGAYQYLVVARPVGPPAAVVATPDPPAAERPSGVRDAAGDDGYYEATREDLRDLIPPGARRVLDVGCGVGRTGDALKADRGCEVIGLEGFPDAAEQARERLDDVRCVDLDALEALPAETGTFDAMLFGDVLEHLRDPARLLRALLPSLADDGVMICSIPNVKHWTVLLPLLVQDRFTYADAGLLDRTHVHFFTLAEISDMLDEVGLEGVQVVPKDFAPLPPELAPLADFAEACGGEHEETRLRLGAYQYLVVAKRA